MPSPLKPPRGIFISSTVLYHPSMNPCLRDTLIQLLGLAWNTSFVSTPPVSYQDLAQITGKKIRTLYGHIAALRDEHAALRLQSAGGGMVIIEFAAWVRPENKPPGAFGKNLQSPVKEEELDSQNNLVNSLLPVIDQQDSINKQQKEVQKFTKRKIFQDSHKKLSEDLCTRLVKAGLFPRLLQEVADSNLPETDLSALLAWSCHDESETPAALFMSRLRAGALTPKIYYETPCPHCGCFGRHSETCRLRYITGEYASLIQH